MKIQVKLSRVHPIGKMKLGKHVVTPEFSTIELEKDEEKILETDEAKHWFTVKGANEKIDDILDVQNKGGRPAKNK